MVLSGHVLRPTLILLFILQTCQNYGTCTQDQTSPRMNTLNDDADDIQRQLDNEARDRAKFGRPKTIWVLHLPITRPPQMKDPHPHRHNSSIYQDGLADFFKMVKDTSPAWDYEGGDGGSPRNRQRRRRTYTSPKSRSAASK